MKNKFKVPKTIKARNAWFNKLTPDEKRVAIAKDVIDQITAEKYVASCGIYMSIDTNKEYKEDESLQKVLDKEESCQVCAMGAIFASKVRLGNEFSVDQLNGWVGDISASDRDILKATDDIFSLEQMRLMEFCFENDDIDSYFWRTMERDDFNTLEAKCNDFYYSYDGDSDRMLAIMQNVIDNNGVFAL